MFLLILRQKHSIMSYGLSDISVSRTKLPEELEIYKELGKGSNNKVFAASYRGENVVFRVPRHRSDTQQNGNAQWEYKHMCMASEWNVGPKIHTAWYARHATREWPSGLYVIMERLDYDMEKALCEDRDIIPEMLRCKDSVEAEVVRCFETLAQNHLFVYDLKPSNMVIRFHEEDNGVDVRVIDFGRDFCECNVPHPTQSSPNIDMLRRRITTEDGDVSRIDERISHILFIVMMIIFSATTTRCLYEDRGHHRMSKSERSNAHPTCCRVQELLTTLCARDMVLVRELMRMDEVRGVLRHYHTRRNSGTGRTIRFACGIENGRDV
tara:strand:- start:26064 stop:27035 length:972 start_codon:yes stop_codon:yes gene_type:complete